MALYEKWTEQTEAHQGRQDPFWKQYLDQETDNYKKILTEKRQEISGTVAELASEFSMEEATFTGFLDGINESIDPVLDLDTLEADTPIQFTIDWEKLYYNMHAAKADWLYNLPEWEPILSEERRKELAKAYRLSGTDIAPPKVGRNEPCPCGSGLKYKKCCGANVASVKAV